MNGFADVDRDWTGAGSLKTQPVSNSVANIDIQPQNENGDIGETYYRRVCCLKETEAMITSLKPRWFLLLGRLAVKIH